MELDIIAAIINKPEANDIEMVRASIIIEL